MLASLHESVTITVPGTATASNPFTQDPYVSNAATVTTRDVVWLNAPTRQLLYDRANGGVLGTVQSGDITLLDEASDFDWDTAVAENVTVTRVADGTRWQALSVGTYQGRGWQLVALKKRVAG